MAFWLCACGESRTAPDTDTARRMWRVHFVAGSCPTGNALGARDDGALWWAESLRSAVPTSFDRAPRRAS